MEQDQNAQDQPLEERATEGSDFTRSQSRRQEESDDWEETSSTVDTENQPDAVEENADYQASSDSMGEGRISTEQQTVAHDSVAESMDSEGKNDASNDERAR
jgi:hypothetical protein